MKLKAIEISRRFIPEFNDNKNQPEGEQIVIHFNRIPGTSEKATYKDFKMGTDGSIGLSYNDNLLVAGFVERIENLEVGEEKINTGKKLATAYHPKLSELFTEIRDYLFPDEEDFTEGE